MKLMKNHQREKRILIEYGDHTIKIIPKGMIELYINNGKRYNSTALSLTGNSWKSETDGIGRIRHYKDNDSNEFCTIKLICTKFKVNGLKDDAVDFIKFSYHNVTEEVNCKSSQRKEGVLLYEIL